MDQDNLIDIEEEDVVVEPVDPDVLAFIDRIHQAQNDTSRERKMQAIEQDKKIRDYQHALYTGGDVPMEKPSEYKMITRFFYGDSYIPPKAQAAKDLIETDEDVIANAVLPTVVELSHFNEIHRDEFLSHHEYTGQPVVKVGMNSTTGMPSCQLVELANLYIDPNGIGLDCADHYKEQNYVKWVCEKIELDHETFVERYPDYADKVVAGDASVDQDEEESTTFRREEKDEHNTNQFITVWDCWYVRGELAVHVKFAGQTATLIVKETGEEYKIRDLQGNPVLPYQEFPFSRDRLGMYSPSIIGSVKDIVENFNEKILNPAISTFIKIANPLHFLVGIETPLEQEAINEYQQMQNLGLNSYVPLVGERSVGVQTASPDVNIISIVNDLRDQALVRIGQRLGLNLFLQEDADFSGKEKVTVFKAKEADTQKSQHDLVVNNKHRYKNLMNLLLAMSIKMGTPKNKRVLVKVPLKNNGRPTGQVVDTELTLKDALEALEGWDNYIEIDTSIDPQLNDEDLEIARDKIMEDLINISASVQILSQQQAKPFIDIMFEKVRSFKMENVISRQEIEDFFMANAQAQKIEQGQQPVDPAQEEANAEAPVALQ